MTVSPTVTLRSIHAAHYHHRTVQVYVEGMIKVKADPELSQLVRRELGAVLFSHNAACLSHINASHLAHPTMQDCHAMIQDYHVTHRRTASHWLLVASRFRWRCRTGSSCFRC